MYEVARALSINLKGSYHFSCLYGFFDPTYTGKAFNGLVELVHRGEIAKGSKVLFWHTGGLMNLMAVRKYMEMEIMI